MAENMVALVFTDLVNSTAIKNNLPGNSIRDRNETYRDTILLPHRQRVTEFLPQYEGRVVEEPPGDVFFWYFLMLSRQHSGQLRSSAVILTIQSQLRWESSP
jgi:hypothetical protein